MCGILFWCDVTGRAMSLDKHTLHVHCNVNMIIPDAMNTLHKIHSDHIHKMFARLNQFITEGTFVVFPVIVSDH